MEEVLEMNLFGDLDLIGNLLHNFSSLITDSHTVTHTVNGKQHNYAKNLPYLELNTYSHTQLTCEIFATCLGIKIKRYWLYCIVG